MNKIYPYLGDTNRISSFKVVFVSEGYLATESPRFTMDCLAFADNMLQMAPFNLSRINPNWLSIYAAFTPSGSGGPAIDTAATPGRTAFESTYDSASGALSFNQEKINTFFGSLQFVDDDQTAAFPDICGPGSINYSKAATLPVILMPTIAGHPDGAETENVPGAGDYYFMATTVDKLWHQVVLRGICRSLGLGDEFELDGPDNLEPAQTLSVDGGLPFNLFYSSTPPGNAKDSIKWLSLFSSTQRSGPIQANLKSGSPATADNSIEQPPLFHPEIEYWEGGGGYRTKVFRSAKDCLLRRKIGSVQLPLREDPLSFCPACFHYLKNRIR